MTINFIGVLAAAVASWIFGAVYYGLLGRQWMAALGRSEEECAQAGKQAPPVAALVLVPLLWPSKPRSAEIGA